MAEEVGRGGGTFRPSFQHPPPEPGVTVSITGLSKLGESQARLERDEQERMVPPADPAGSVRAGKQGVDLIASEE